MKTETLDSIGAAGTKVSIVGAGTAGAGLLSASELAAIVGALVAIAGFVITWHYKREAARLRREEYAGKERERELRMQLMRQTGMPVSCDTGMGDLDRDEA